MLKPLKSLTCLLLLSLVSLVAACGPKGAGGEPAPGAAAPQAGAAAFDLGALNNSVDQSIGGLGTCVIIRDTVSGREVYHYGDAVPCMAHLPPCDLFDIPNSLIGLDRGLIIPGGVVKWDGKPAQMIEWQKDMTWSQAFHIGNEAWFGQLAAKTGLDGYAQGLRALDYGDHNTAGPPTQFWMGPQAGGGLTVTEGQQADFIRRFYAGDLTIKPDAIHTVQAQTLDETRTDAKGAAVTVSGRAASCPTTPAGDRNIGWWVGRVQSPQSDLSFSASVEGTEAPPGMEVERLLKAAFVAAHILPPAPD